MRFLLAAILALWTFAASAQEAIIGSGVFGGTKASVAGYTGPGDLSINSNVMVWHGFSCYSSTYTGNVASITDSNQATTAFTMSCATGGVLSATNGAGGTIATLVTDCNSSHAYCTVSTWRDQSGKTNCTGTACDYSCVGTCQVISNCPNFTTSPAFCYVAILITSGRLVTNNSFNPTTTSPYSMIALEYPKSVSSSDDLFFQVNNSSFNLSTTRYRFYNGGTGGTSPNLFINVAPSGWQVMAAADNNSTSLTSYFQLNNGTNSISGVLGTTTFGGNSIYEATAITGDVVYVAEDGIWSGDIHASFTNYYSNASTRLGGF